LPFCEKTWLTGISMHNKEHKLMRKGLPKEGLFI